jgi:hypothetical protein
MSLYYFFDYDIRVSFISPLSNLFLFGRALETSPARFSDPYAIMAAAAPFQPPIHADPTTNPPVTNNPDHDPVYVSNVNWGTVKLVANSGVRIVYGGPHYGRDPPGGPPRGIGIWKRNSPNHRSWDGLLEIPLHLIVTRWIIGGVTFGLRLPIMGMPPREPTDNMMQDARSGDTFLEWFVYATVIPARLLANWVNIDPKTATMELKGSWRDYNFSTASPENDILRNHVTENDKSLDNLYYIQLLRNELPSYHFWSYTDPIPRSGQMRHGIIAKGASACYDIDGSNMITNVHLNFNRLQNLPLRRGDPAESERIRNRDPNYNRRRSRSPRERDPNVRSRNWSYESLEQPRRSRARKRPTAKDASYRPRKGSGEEPQEVKLNNRKKKGVEDVSYRPRKGSGEEPQELTLNKRKKMAVGEDEKTYKPETSRMRKVFVGRVKKTFKAAKG